MENWIWVEGLLWACKHLSWILAVVLVYTILENLQSMVEVEPALVSKHPSISLQEDSLANTIAMKICRQLLLWWPKHPYSWIHPAHLSLEGLWEDLVQWVLTISATPPITEDPPSVQVWSKATFALQATSTKDQPATVQTTLHYAVILQITTLPWTPADDTVTLLTTRLRPWNRIAITSKMKKMFLMKMTSDLFMIPLQINTTKSIIYHYKYTSFYCYSILRGPLDSSFIYIC